MARKFITYFDNEGTDYTDELISAVKDKLDMADHIKHVVIASASGKSALKLADAVGDKVKIINVTWNQKVLQLTLDCMHLVALQEESLINMVVFHH